MSIHQQYIYVVLPSATGILLSTDSSTEWGTGEVCVRSMIDHSYPTISDQVLTNVPCLPLLPDCQQYMWRVDRETKWLATASLDSCLRNGGKDTFYTL